MTPALTVLAAVVAVSVLTIHAKAEQQTGPARAPLISESTYGPDLYRSYCASCHGTNGTGNGPVAPALKVPPTNLTPLSAQAKGVFPASEVESVLRGTALPAHGSNEMPVWGPIFKALDPSDARVKARIASLVAYLRSIQRP